MRHAALLLSSLLAGCTCAPIPPPFIDAAILPGFDAGVDAEVDAARPDTGPRDAGMLDPDAACAATTVTAQLERAPVDIIWMVDNSISMQPAIDEVTAGLNNFAALIEARDLDYRVIMLSLRGMGAGTYRGGARYQVCIPEPLAGPSCADRAPVFHQVEIDVRSTQPLEQFLGSLGQTYGYEEPDDRGSAPWLDLLRPDATKTIVVVTDDNARMVVRADDGSFEAGPGLGIMGDPVATADWFETTADASPRSNPFNNVRTLPEGILDPRWGGLFDGYTFSALYGWGSETDPTVECTYPDGSNPPASGRTYTELVARTGGVRAQICAGATAWGPFFDAVATAVDRASRIDCSIPIPDPPDGMFFERDQINVFITEEDVSTRFGKVAGIAECDERGGWYYDNEMVPTSVELCPMTCDAVQPEGLITRAIGIQFGCQTTLI